ncbi:MAG: Rrf2 family transcriptional regulator [candidate division NC10 bacterium]|nr:Rrf2 family transcriptional regulator [candidate division NC10 bacterium]MBI4842057.1 Rrf2 family transcriptional regulator [candidate division NC10 bacterium]
MRISTKGDYATRALQDLALRYAEGPVPIEAIAQRQALPARYLEQLLLSLKRAGYLASKRGVNGGYYLAKPPREITLGQVLRAVDGPVAPIFCVSEENPREHCSQETFCALRDVWAEVRDAVSAIVDHTTLADICDRIRAKTKERISYQI